jgi:two-component system chemotaxis sensor kinase CheA
MIRNSVDHGLEMPEERIRLGKPEKGLIQLKAYHRGGNIVIE